MDMNVSIIAVQENIDQIYRNFSKDISKYISDMNVRIDNIRNEIQGLSRDWSGEDYNQFKTQINRELEKVESSLERCQKLKELTDEASKELEISIELLKGNN